MLSACQPSPSAVSYCSSLIPFLSDYRLAALLLLLLLLLVPALPRLALLLCLLSPQLRLLLLLLQPPNQRSFWLETGRFAVPYPTAPQPYRTVRVDTPRPFALRMFPSIPHDLAST